MGIKKIGLIVNTKKDNGLGITQKLIKYLQEKNVEIFVSKQIRDRKSVV